MGTFALRRLLSALILILSITVTLAVGGVTFGNEDYQSAKHQPRPKPAATVTRPRLVLLIAVDQFRYDYLERFGSLFGPNGFRRLLRGGASWVNANYDHVPTSTAPGHATMLTGAYPAETGIVANEWPDRETGKKVTSVSDLTAKLFGGGPTEDASSPRRLMASTVGDELKLVTRKRAKVIGISEKDRSAILPGGRHANAAYWFSLESGNMVSSDYYFRELPAWVSDFNRARPFDKYFNAKWERLLPEAEYLKRAGPDSPPWEKVIAKGDTNRFPHTISGGAKGPGRDFYDAVTHSPFHNDLLLSFTEQAIQNEQLGQDADTDVLSVSFSANDHIGHRFGPFSQEVMDAALRVDLQIGALLEFVDSHVGLQNTIVVLTADHGVAPAPEHATTMGLTAGRVQKAEVLKAVLDAITARYNPRRISPNPAADYIYKYEADGRLTDAFINGNLYFNHAALKRDGVRLEEIEKLAGDAALTVPGIARYWTRTQLQRVAPVSNRTLDQIERRVIHGFYPSRSGDVIVIAKPYYYLASANVATHASPYPYDTHVPVIMMGRGLTPGRYRRAATPADIAPTLAALLGIRNPSNSKGRILREAFQNRGR